ncbi:MAG: hypothetical protein BZY88_18740 [SAR202 cluster bacterium Io17-Chloro-G9]|nr:MAG: hypothetical protein BZY88_18740 [SAR202 cluster bacterium Io17-Chloro-G9]
MKKQDPAIGFIGIGVLGKGLPLCLADRGYRVTAAYSRSPDSAQWLAGRLPGCGVFSSAQGLCDATDLVFITTPDSEIGRVAASVSWRPGQGVVHCCGAASRELLNLAVGQGAFTGAFHPYQTFAGLEAPEDIASRLSGVAFAVAGQDWLGSYLGEMATELGGHPVSISDADRPLYHASAVLACGYLVALLKATIQVWQAMGFSDQEALDALYPISRATLDNLAKAGAEASVTGPVVRGDIDTLRSHLETLSERLPEVAPVYAALTTASLGMAAQRGMGAEQLKDLQRLVQQYKAK